MYNNIDMKKIFVIVIIIIFTIGQVVLADSFQKLKDKLNRKGCFYFEFINLIESDIFDQVDTTYGSAFFASDGRYNIKMGDEQYLYDLKKTYEYSRSNNQVIIEDPDSSGLDEMIFLTKLDKIYKTFIIKSNKKYRLLKKSDISGDYPDSMIVIIDKEKVKLKQIDYFDVNDELNKIIFLKQKYNLPCDHNLFEPQFPDSVERVKL
ncbi:MAG: hypothetical protein GXO93_04515 [FCB group bacterium]|nr:hypothetical protein [FCB group bacterium]